MGVDWLKAEKIRELERLSKPENSDRETRSITTELRFDESKNVLVGYAAMYNVWSQNLGGFRERILPGAFDRALSGGQDVRALMNHDPNFVLGRTKSGTLSLTSDDVGLRVAIKPPESEWAKGLMESVRRGDIDQMSFQFRAIEGGDRWFGDDASTDLLRELRDVDLFDVSPVTFPAYPQTTLSAREQRMLQTMRKAAHNVELTDDERETLRGLIDTPQPAADDSSADAEKRARMRSLLHDSERKRLDRVGRKYARLYGSAQPTGALPRAK